MKFLLVCCASLAAVNAVAQESVHIAAYDPAVSEEMVVTASRSPMSVKDTLASTTVVTREEIEKTQARDLFQLLRTIPGVYVRRNGGPGSSTSLSLRGGSNRGTLVLVDGVKVESATLGEVALQQISIDQIERIEVVRGPKSGLYGSSAMSGVVQIFTRKANPEVGVKYTLAAGDNSTKEGVISLNGNNETSRINVTASHISTEGFDALYADDDLSGDSYYDLDNDGSRKSSLSVNLEQDINELFSANFIFNRSEGENEFDTKYSPNSLPYSDFGTTMYMAALNLNYENYSSRLKYAVYEDLSEQGGDSFVPDSFIETYRSIGQWENTINIIKQVTLSFGADYEHEEVDRTTAYSQDKRDNFAGYSHIILDFGIFSFNGGLRHDNNEQFGGKWTGDVAFGLSPSDSVNLMAAYGTGFKTPSFNDLYWPFDGLFIGNPNLSPELSETYEVGVDYFADSTTISVHAYRSEVDNLIEWFNYGTRYTPENVASVKIQGLEAQYGANILDFELAVSANYEKVVDESTEEDLQRRPRRFASLLIDRDLGQFRFGATVYAQSQHYDTTGGERVVVPGFGQLDLRAAFQVNDSMTLRAKVDNVFDNEFVEVYGYNIEGRFVMFAIDIQTN